MRHFSCPSHCINKQWTPVGIAALQSVSLLFSLLPSKAQTTRMSQLVASIRLLQSGALLLTTGFVFGMFVHSTKYPRIALSAHINILQHGLLSIAAGLILRTEAVKLDEWQVWVVFVAHLYSWFVNFVSACNAWWGASKTTPIVSFLMA